MKEYHNRPIYDVVLYEYDETTENETPYNIRAKIMTPDRVNKAFELEKNTKLSNSDKIVEQMIILFGHDKKFYSKFDLFILGKVVEETMLEITKKKEK